MGEIRARPSLVPPDLRCAWSALGKRVGASPDVGRACSWPEWFGGRGVALVADGARANLGCVLFTRVRSGNACRNDAGDSRVGHAADPPPTWSGADAAAARDGLGHSQCGIWTF